MPDGDLVTVLDNPKAKLMRNPTNVSGGGKGFRISTSGASPGLRGEAIESRPGHGAGLSATASPQRSPPTPPTLPTPDSSAPHDPSSARLRQPISRAPTRLLIRAVSILKHQQKVLYLLKARDRNYYYIIVLLPSFAFRLRSL